ncbi:hypothetical protein [Microcoleus sp. bin38.metabat.b11b12b14.051]|uniref:hypothetical protein n=1 Tax=Microcoleus sp. bin38.metabat.b11b12b14.051 TaxID=2742709 RepID=UPI0025CD2E59|nr:hypothetical protein [Microcoleus sp. bin38.metabat.b11b12b14.051]
MVSGCWWAASPAASRKQRQSATTALAATKPDCPCLASVNCQQQQQNLPQALKVCARMELKPTQFSATLDASPR